MREIRETKISDMEKRKGTDVPPKRPNLQPLQHAGPKPNRTPHNREVGNDEAYERE